MDGFEAIRSDCMRYVTSDLSQATPFFTAIRPDLPDPSPVKRRNLFPVLYSRGARLVQHRVLRLALPDALERELISTGVAP